MAKNISTTKTLKIERTDIVSIAIFAVVLFLTWQFMHRADHFLLLTREALGKYFKLKWILIAHITAGGGSLVLGLLQFWPKLRDWNLKVHRVIGFLYLIAVLVSSVCAVILAFTTAREVNWAYAFSLQIWVSVWISSTAIAYYAAIKRRFTHHREWMTRSYIVTLAFIISGLVLKIPFIQSFGSFADISPSLFWMGWSLPLYLYQILLGFKKKTS
ncbi:DUF2306 domain-containing protein [Pedobacter psychrodurus]|uniref:DUF2306 domain-containing protein n=1 Tax=Pedobacter psychrodurus TaxID=2530456 RepID=A0A4R0PZS1_9SPHI|nr:DUF2306 domain-containing protein [Pedobacter psychrodurus]TCD28762.1 DUF2306 domain-containing protein [Pedobacter psychrodurus]